MSMRPRAIGFVLLLTLLLSANGPAADPPKDDAGWKDLFDGKSLDGWKACDFYAPGKVHVEDGAVVMDKGKIMTGVVYTRGDFPKMDYEFILEGKKIDGDDFFCTTTFRSATRSVRSWSAAGAAAWSACPASTARTPPRTRRGRTRSSRTTNGTKSASASAGSGSRPGSTATKVVDLDTTDRKISIRVECNACKPFGIATYQTTGAIRNIRVRPLSEADKKKE